jgi:hypothetical protein
VTVHEACSTCTCKPAPPQPVGTVPVSDVNGDIWCPEYRDGRNDIWSCLTSRESGDESWQVLWNWNKAENFNLVIYRKEQDHG